MAGAAVHLKAETDETVAMKRQIARACWDVAGGTARMEISKKHSQPYIDLFKHLEEKLDLSNIGEVLAEFKKIMDTQEKLRDEIEDMSKEIAEI